MPVLKRSESSIQTAVVKYARQLGWRCRKRSTSGPMGSNGEPDYEFMRPRRRLFFIEFKAPGKTSTPLQLQMQAEIAACGYDVFECDDAAKGKALVALKMKMP